MRNFELNEGLIKVPPALMQKASMLIVRQIIWRLWSRWTPSVKKANPEGWKAFLTMAMEYMDRYGFEVPRTQWNAPENGYESFKLPVTGEGLPANYPAPIDGDAIRLFLNWSNMKLIGASRGTKAGWVANKRILVLNLFNCNSISHHPQGYHDAASVAYEIEEMLASAEHELRHAVQSVFLHAHPEQSKLLPKYGAYGSEYYRSPTEFDPQIGDCVKDFLAKWKQMASDERVNGRFKMGKCLRQYVGMARASAFDVFSAPPFFKTSRTDSPKKYRLAVKKFIVAVQEELKGEKLKEAYTNYMTSEVMPDFDTCAIKTGAFLTGKDDNVVWKAARQFWRPKRGMDSLQCSRMLQTIGFQFGAARFDLVQKGPTLGALYAALRREPPQKAFWIVVPNHAIGFKGGNILDVGDTSQGVKVLAVHEVVPIGTFHEDEEDRLSRLKFVEPEYFLPNLAQIVPEAMLPEVVKNGEKMVTIYRGVPSDVNEIRPGDWVALSPAYAGNHGLVKGKSRILKKQVPAKHVAWAGTDMHEYFYVPPLSDPEDGDKKTIKVYIDEGMAQTRIHKNPSPTRLKALIDGAKHGDVRFVIDKGGVMHAGDAEHFVHTDLHPDRSQWAVRGHAGYNATADHHYVSGVDPEGNDVDHEYIARLRDHGFFHDKVY